MTKDEAAMNNMINAIANYGITAEKAAEAISKVVSKLPPPGEAEIAMISMNPSLNFFQRRRLIGEIRQDMRTRQQAKNSYGLHI
ncbi:MAG: hypothetical protein IJI23_00295 [Lachnospiraceae bacterium]|nr:hypothetical protein [Lachnospiraceae bacterium]